MDIYALLGLGCHPKGPPAFSLWYFSVCGSGVYKLGQTRHLFIFWAEFCKGIPHEGEPLFQEWKVWWNTNSICEYIQVIYLKVRFELILYVYIYFMMCKYLFYQIQTGRKKTRKSNVFKIQELVVSRQLGLNAQHLHFLEIIVFSRSSALYVTGIHIPYISQHYHTQHWYMS